MSKRLEDMMIDQHTICAIATAQGGALGIIRISGANAIDIAHKLFKPANPKHFN